ncbi:hydroxyethylthiazole kinase [Brevibacterium sp. 5221]|uniref:Hydroxyethylthiazole kinase n=1 Tax=Brevibacterium rongguiense TaxID=2695267 RepID=A0A6N9H7B0_9MICO|nr:MULTISPECIES: hydroxyethylthiazole kinase [Brevibacterium]MYM19958.1 hydroxyethylthiazole kinase [Brevibacterium rongguiense]WAL41015.1 hydroxyethylthiazole kinase [Brevibacterium sp. BRM-1]
MAGAVTPFVTPAACGRVLSAVRADAPLVHCASSAVSMPTVADALLAAGARPVMTVTQVEAPLVVTGAAALLVNLGTLSEEAARAIVPTVAAARSAGLPWVLDPAAVGARTPVRTRLARTLVAEHSPTVIRCNAAEAAVLAGTGTGGSGPDARAGEAAARYDFEALDRAVPGIVCVTGEVDRIAGPAAPDLARTGEARTGEAHTRTRVELRRGDPLLTRVTGTGCALGALSAACAAAAEHPLTGAVAAAAWMSLAGEWAAARTRLPGSFRTALLDGLASVEPADVEAALSGAGASIASTHPDSGAAPDAPA